MKNNAPGIIEQTYQSHISSERIQEDGTQHALVRQLDALLADVQKKTSPRLWCWRKKPAPVKGIYIYGQVGRGKTMLMDLFHASLTRKDKKRVHFNNFMNDVQDALARQRQLSKAGKSKESDPIAAVAASLAREAGILCFDEFTVTDIADAMILARLFTHLFRHGVVLVATSNVAPKDLYKNGLNRDLFVPFIKILQQHVELFNLDGSVDYRLIKTPAHPLYLYPYNHDSVRQMESAWEQAVRQIAPLHENIDTHITVRGHKIVIPRSAGTAARFDFSHLCGRALAAHDYNALVKKYHSFFIDNVPVFDTTMRNEAKRFILLIDTLYDARVRLFVTAAAPPDDLFRTRYETVESFEFARTASRLHEMQTQDYLNRCETTDKARTSVTS